MKPSLELEGNSIIFKEQFSGEPEKTSLLLVYCMHQYLEDAMNAPISWRCTECANILKMCFRNLFIQLCHKIICFQHWTWVRFWAWPKADRTHTYFYNAQRPHWLLTLLLLPHLGLPPAKAQTHSSSPGWFPVYLFFLLHSIPLPPKKLSPLLYPCLNYPCQWLPLGE